MRREEHPSSQERERESWLGLLFLYVSLSLGLSYVNWASQECCLFYLRSSLQSSDLLLFYFWGFSLLCLLATAILDSFSLFYLPNTLYEFLDSTSQGYLMLFFSLTSLSIPVSGSIHALATGIILCCLMT